MSQPFQNEDEITSQIFFLRGQRIMLDTDLAKIYGVETRVLNQAVKRNLHRFPEDFMFQLTDEEIFNLKSQIVISSLSFFLLLFSQQMPNLPLIT